METPLDMDSEIKKCILKQTVTSAEISSAGDITITLANHAHLQIFNFTSYEAWEIQFTDGTSEYSNYWKNN